MKELEKNKSPLTLHLPLYGEMHFRASEYQNLLGLQLSTSMFLGMSYCNPNSSFEIDIGPKFAKLGSETPSGGSGEVVKWWIQGAHFHRV